VGTNLCGEEHEKKPTRVTCFPSGRRLNASVITLIEAVLSVHVILTELSLNRLLMSGEVAGFPELDAVP
jgi:hypothetical protein